MAQFGLLIVCVIVFVYAWCVRQRERYLFGFWTAAADDFCERAGVDNIMFYVGEPQGWFNRTRVCYLVIMDNVYNSVVTLNYTLAAGSVHAQCTCEDFDIWPERVVITVDIESGSMRVCDAQGNLLAKLHKQHETTNLCMEMSDVEIV